MCAFHARGQCKYGAGCSYAHAASEVRQPLNLRKTRLCLSFQKGRCSSSSSNCNFAHGAHELRAPHGLYKTQLCLFWLAGRCGAGRSCRHAHGDEELQQKPQSPGPPRSSSPARKGLAAARGHSGASLDTLAG
ncbi:Zinc finger, CCCH type domain-containing protein, related, partial [Eimeria necatrix]